MPPEGEIVEYEAGMVGVNKKDGVENKEFVTKFKKLRLKRALLKEGEETGK